MSEYIIYYTESNVVCLIIFGIILIHDLFNVDRQEKQIKYDHALIAFMCYFASDTLWAMMIAGVLPKNIFTVITANFLNYLFMSLITYTWLLYAMAVLQSPNRNKTSNKIIILSPFIVSTVLLLALFIVAPNVLLDEELLLKPLYNVFLVVVPGINIAAALFYCIRKARRETNLFERQQYIYVGLFPIFVVLGGIMQIIVLPNTPIFCFCCAILMIIFKIKSMQTEISLDPLTGLNNRGQLMRYTSQRNVSSSDEKQTYVVMMDVNSFKAINDTYGHEEGDRALIIIADSLKKAAKTNAITQFIGRYGGDEFIMIVQTDDTEKIDSLIEDIRRAITSECERTNSPYIRTIGAGWDEVMGEGDSFKSCILRADRKLYLDKEYLKLNGKSTVVRRKAAG